MDRPFSAILSAASLLATLLLTILAMMALQAIWKTTDLQGPSPSTVGNAPAVDKDMLINNSTVTSPLVGATPSLSAAGSVDRAGIPATSDNLGATPVPFPTPTPGPTTTPFPAAPQNPRFGIAWSSSFYNSQRPNLPTGKAIEAGATWDRWPMSWHMVEPNGDGRFRWVSQDINFFLGVTQDRPRYAEPASPDPELQILVVLSDIPERYIQVQDGQIESILGLGEPVFLAGR